MKHFIKKSIEITDLTAWWITILFFIGSAFFYWWNISESFLWALWIIFLTFFVWFSIELILDSLKNIKWLWEVTGFITNWPEALVLIVWLISWNIIFAASTPLGSNLVNPILLFIAILITWSFLLIKKFRHKIFYPIWFLLTATFASSFFIIDEKYYWFWAILWIFLTFWLFYYNRKISHKSSDLEDTVEEIIENSPKYYLPVWVIILFVAWYFLDPVVSFASEVSKAPKWIIWFVVLSTLTSWPEFKSCISLLKKKRTIDAFINILISNIANIWLALIWILAWFSTK